MKYAVLCIGSNEASAPELIAESVSRLKEGGCQVIKSSDVYVVNQPYYNHVVLASSALDYANLRTMAKDIETAMGRRQQHKQQGRVIIDIDIVIFEGKLIRSYDYAAQYFQLGYKQIL